jgi:hypothetical protein
MSTAHMLNAVAANTPTAGSTIGSCLLYGRVET